MWYTNVDSKLLAAVAMMAPFPHPDQLCIAPQRRATRVRRTQRPLRADHILVAKHIVRVIQSLGLRVPEKVGGRAKVDRVHIVKPERGNEEHVAGRELALDGGIDDGVGCGCRCGCGWKEA